MPPQCNIPIERKALIVPPLEEIAKVLNQGLKQHFKEVNVSVVDCPDLRQQPFTLACSGLGGRPIIFDVGGPAYLLPTANRSKIYDLCSMGKIARVDPAFIIGAGAGPFHIVKTNCEGVYNLQVSSGKVSHQFSYISRVNSADPEKPIQDLLPSTVTSFGLLGNFFVSQGNPGRVLRVHVSHRIGDSDFIASLRTTLGVYYGPEAPVGLGGTFLMKEGQAKTHVMPDFSAKPLRTDEELNQWLTFYNMSAPLISVGTLVSADIENMDLRVQHFHLFSHHGQAGHYHNDTTPDIVDYLGFFNVADEIIRVDKPPQAATFGKD